jgi:hypothetical protein
MTLEDVNIKDLKGPDDYDSEVYVDYKLTSRSTWKKNSFDNNLDYVMLNSPDIHLIREPDGYFNTDHWMDKIRVCLK